MKALGLPFGISLTFWLAIGFFRFLNEKVLSWLRFKRKKRSKHYKRSDIAVILPAHNEEKVIRSSIQSLKKSLDASQIYVVSDGSTDKTYRRARSEKCHVSKLEPGRGKAKALVYLLEKYRLMDKYKLIFVVDADTKIDQAFVPNALKMLKDPSIAVVFGSTEIYWHQHLAPSWQYYVIAYRERLNKILTYCLTYGQTWKYANVSFVVPGFAAMYKSEILRKLEIDTPGLLIEDFNLAFQLHKKKLGKIGYSSKMIGWDQHPNNLEDYWRQVRRWNIGFFQTVRKHKFWPSLFWLFLFVFTIEVFLNSIFILLLPFVLIFMWGYFAGGNSSFSEFLEVGFDIWPFGVISLGAILGIVLFLDYVITAIVGIINRKPQFLFYGLFFFFMHYVTAMILVSSIVPGFFGHSDGRWKPPSRWHE